jgi:hypothetical protein
MPAPLPRWFDAYHGEQLGKVTRDGFPEPYIGDLLGTPRVVVLGLNPGDYVPAFQARDGIFADEIRRHRSYRLWAATDPYGRPPWTKRIGPNKYLNARKTFSRRWLDDPTADHRDLLIFEFYPWHSKKITAPMKPEPEIIDEFILQPIAELPVADVFAFGRAWDHLAVATGLRCTAKLGLGGTGYGSGVASRAVRVYELAARQRLIVEWHSGSFGPPNESETALLREALR